MPIQLSVPLRAILGAASFLFLAGCSCEDETETSSQPEGPPPPLVAVGVPRSVQAELYPLVGSSSRRPVVMTLAEEARFCEQTRASFSKLAHVICSSPSSDGSPSVESEAKLRNALVFLKKSYPRYLSKSPVIFVVGPSYEQIGWKMLLAEPGFFAHTYVSGENQPELSNTLMAALHGKGAKTLILDGELGSADRIISQAAGRAGLRLESVGSGPEALKRALAILVEADPRLQVSPEAAQASSKASSKH